MKNADLKNSKRWRTVAKVILISIGAILAISFLIDFIGQLNDPNPIGATALVFFSLVQLGFFLFFAFFVSVPFIIIWQIRTYRAKNQTPKSAPQQPALDNQDDDSD